MPWEELKPMDLKVMFIAAYLAERDTFNQLCRDYQVSERLAAWVECYEAEGPRGLEERSRCQHNQTYVVPLAIISVSDFSSHQK